MEDDKTLNQLLEEHYSLLFGYIFKLSGNREITEDVVQETMVKIILNYKGFRHKCQFNTWAIRIATNTFRDEQRKRQNKTISLDEFPIARSDSFEERILLRDLNEKLDQAILGLPLKLRTVFILKNDFKFTYKEMAKALKCPIGTIRSRLHQTIFLLREELR